MIARQQTSGIWTEVGTDRASAWRHLIERIFFFFFEKRREATWRQRSLKKKFDTVALRGYSVVTVKRNEERTMKIATEQLPTALRGRVFWYLSCTLTSPDKYYRAHYYFICKTKAEAVEMGRRVEENIDAGWNARLPYIGWVSKGQGAHAIPSRQGIVVSDPHGLLVDKLYPTAIRRPTGRPQLEKNGYEQKTNSRRRTGR